jgi:hypothetical protein
MGGGWKSGGPDAFCLPGLVGRLDFSSAVFFACRQASSTDAFVISYKSLWRYEFFLVYNSDWADPEFDLCGDIQHSTLVLLRTWRAVDKLLRMNPPDLSVERLREE